MHVHRKSNRESPKMGKYCPYYSTEGLGIWPNGLYTKRENQKVGTSGSTSGLGNRAYGAFIHSGTYPMGRQCVEVRPWRVRFGVFRRIALASK
jgi:hypothetical protein